MSLLLAVRPQRAANAISSKRCAAMLGFELLLAACSLDQPQAGDSCRRSTECPPGLACIRSVCTNDLRAVAEESTVPDLMSDPPEADADGGAVAADGGN